MPCLHCRPVLLACLVLILPRAGAQSPFLDADFDPPHVTSGGTAARLELLSDGSYVANSFYFTGSLANERSLNLVKFNADGTRDPAWEAALAADERRGNAVYLLAGEAGRVYLLTSEPSFPGYAERERVERRLADGTLDPAFTPFTFTADGDPRTLARQPDGGLIVAGQFRTINGTPRAGAFRLNADGSFDAGFAASTMEALTGVYAPPVVDAAGRIYVAGDFTTYGGQSRPGLVRLNPNGTVDPNYLPRGFTRTGLIRGLGLQSDGRLVAGGRFTVGATANVPLIRLGVDGELDAGFAVPARPGFNVKDLLVLPDDGIAAADTTIARYAADGAPLAAAQWAEPVFAGPDFVVSILALRRAPDGDLVAGGTFDTVNEQPRATAVRFSPTGELRPLSLPRIAAVSYPRGFARFTDGTGLAVYSFGETVARLDADGAALPLDAWRATLGSFGWALDLDQDPASGRAWLLYTNEAGARRLARLSGAGAIEQTTPIPTEWAHLNRVKTLPGGGGVLWLSGPVSAQLLLTDPWRPLGRFDDAGQAVVGYASDLPERLPAVSRAAPVAPETVGAITSLNLNPVRPLAATAAGAVYVAYGATDGTERLVRLRPDGTVDPAFASVAVAAPSRVSAYTAFAFSDPLRPQAPAAQLLMTQPDGPALTTGAVQPDGAVVVAGRFDEVAGVPTPGVARFSATGQPDAGFAAAIGHGPGWGPLVTVPGEEPAIDAVVTTSGDRLLLAGNFGTWDGVAAPGLVRLQADGTRDPTYVAPARRVSGSLDVWPRLIALPDGSAALTGPFAVTGELIPRTLLRLTTEAGVAPATRSYRGTLAAGGEWAATVAADGTGVLLLALPDEQTWVVVTFTVDAAGNWIVANQEVRGPSRDPARAEVRSAARGAQPRRPRLALATVLEVTGRWVQEQLSFAVPALAVAVEAAAPEPAGATQARSGLYVASAPNVAEGGTSHVLLGTAGTALVVVHRPGEVRAVQATATAQADELVLAAAPVGGMAVAGTIADQGAALQLTVTPPGAEPITMSGTTALNGARVRLANISTRGRVSANGAAMIAGFVVAGEAPRPVMIRASGPALIAFGVTRPVEDPRFELVRQEPGGGSSSLAVVEDWAGADVAQAGARLGAFPLAPGSRDAAALFTLPPGAYTALVAGTSGEPGEALVEVYDASVDESVSRLVNISTRAEVTAEVPVIIAGFVVTGPAPRRLLVRGIGPALAGFGVGAAVPDPELSLYRSLPNGESELLLSNDDWATSAAVAPELAAAAVKVGAFALAPASRDAGLLVTLPPGAYTAHVGAKGDEGEVLVEVYEVP